MKSYLPHASSVLMVLILIGLPSFNGTARVHRAHHMPTQQDESQLPELTQRAKFFPEALRAEVAPECNQTAPDVQTHDKADEFAPLGSTVNLSNALLERLHGGLRKGYDDQTPERFFADSFQIRACRVCYATLEFRIRNYGVKGFDNDHIEAGVAPFNKPGVILFQESKLWNLTEKNQTKTLTLTPTTNGITALNSFLKTVPIPASFDVLGQDDTDFDYVTLKVWYY